MKITKYVIKSSVGTFTLDNFKSFKEMLIDVQKIIYDVKYDIYLKDEYIKNIHLLFDENEIVDLKENDFIDKIVNYIQNDKIYSENIFF